MTAKEMYKQAYSDRRNKNISPERFLAFWGLSAERINISEMAVKSYVKRNHKVEGWKTGLRFMIWKRYFNLPAVTK